MGLASFGFLVRSVACPPDMILVFGEDENDRRALVELTRGLRPDLSNVKIQTRRNPVIHMKKGDLPATKRRVVDEVAALVRAQQVLGKVTAVIAHEDCDDLEPAHVDLSNSIEAALTAAGVPQPIAATPAWEMEAWWMLFPNALAEVRRCWKQLQDRPRNVGMVRDAKESLMRSLRPSPNNGRCPDYAESDSVQIAKNAARLGLLAQNTQATSASFNEFRRKVLALRL